MSHTDSVSLWIDQLKAGQDAAAQKLWAMYVDRLINEARKRLPPAERRVADEDDIAARAFDGFLRGVNAGRFSRLNDRQDLWQILVMLVDRRATDQRKHNNAAKRGNGDVRGESIYWSSADSGQMPSGIDQVADPRPTPEFTETFLEELRHCLARVKDQDLLPVVLAKMEGYTNREIAARIGKSVSAVERKLERIRDEWERYSNR